MIIKSQYYYAIRGVAAPTILQIEKNGKKFSPPIPLPHPHPLIIAAMFDKNRAVENVTCDRLMINDDDDDQ